VPTALITGAAGQDGLHLARYLKNLGYRVVAVVQYGSAPERERICGFVGDVEVVTGDLTDFASLVRAIQYAEPDEIYNLGGISSVRLAWEQPIRTVEVNGVGLVNLLEALRSASTSPPGRARVFQASSAQMFGDIEGEWFTEETPIRPNNLYGTAKAYAHFAADAYRRRYGLFVSCGILGNHESALHDDEFVVRKITRGVSRIATGETQFLTLDNLDATRDWGYAGDFVVAMHAALQLDRPEDFVIATGELRSVSEVAAIAFAAAGITDWRWYVRTSNGVTGQIRRGAKGDSRKAHELLGWVPKVGFEELVGAMVKSDLDAARRTGPAEQGRRGDR
jgi:GDPmannose 4,6-dehydratase